MVSDGVDEAYEHVLSVEIDDVMVCEESGEEAFRERRAAERILEVLEEIFDDFVMRLKQ